MVKTNLAMDAQLIFNNKVASCCSTTNNNTQEQVTILPAHVIGRSVGSFLDRCSWNALRLTCREVRQSMDGMSRPWPHGRLSVGNNKQTSSLGVQSLAFSSDGSSLACRSRGGTIKLWNQNDGKQIEWPSRGTFAFGNLCFSPDNRVLACDGCGKSLRLYDVASGTCIQSFRGHQGAITSICFSPSSSTVNNQRQLLASGSTDSTVRIWDRSLSSSSTNNKSQEQAILHGHMGAIYSIAISPDGQFLASGGTDRILRVWDLQKVMNNTPNDDFCQELDGHEMTIVEVAFVDTAASSAYNQHHHYQQQKQLLVSASLDMTVRLWSTRGATTDHDGPREPKRTRAGQSFSSIFQCHQIIRLDSEALTMRVSPDGTRLAVGTSDEIISVWNLTNLIAKKDGDDHHDNEGKKNFHHLPLSTHPGRLVSFAPRIMATSGKDGFIQLRECS